MHTLSAILLVQHVDECCHRYDSVHVPTPSALETQSAETRKDHGFCHLRVRVLVSDIGRLFQGIENCFNYLNHDADLHQRHSRLHHAFHPSMGSRVCRCNLRLRQHHELECRRSWHRHNLRQCWQPQALNCEILVQGSLLQRSTPHSNSFT